MAWFHYRGPGCGTGLIADTMHLIGTATDSMIPNLNFATGDMHLGLRTPYNNMQSPHPAGELNCMLALLHS